MLVISTDYRDLRKSAYQEYVVAWDFNTVRLPAHISYEAGATLGVAFVAAALVLGVNLGVDFTSIENGPDLLRIVRQLPSDSLPADIRQECLGGISENERARPGDWLAIWGGSSASAHLTIQLAHLAGLKVVAVVDKAKHALRLAVNSNVRPDLLIDSHDPQRAIAILRANLGQKLLFGLDTSGRESASWLLEALAGSTSQPSDRREPPSPPSTPQSEIRVLSHLVGLAGLPKGEPPRDTIFHTVPIKLFHEVPAVGDALSIWLENLLFAQLLEPPEVLGTDIGLESINASLDRMRAGEVSGGRLVITL